jgi:hypothetical protein
MSAHVQDTFIDELHSLVITAITTHGHHITVKSASERKSVAIVCSNATLLGASMDYVSLLRLSPEDRCIVRVHVVVIDQDTILFLILERV